MRKCSKPEKKIYLILNKPKGYVCSTVSDSHKTVYELLSSELHDLVTEAPRGSRLHTVGRLDCDTSGLLLITNDGMFSHNIAANQEIAKSYRAKLTRPVPREEQTFYIEKAASGLILPPEKKYGEQQAAPATLHFINDAVCEITVHEGKFHEVRRIFRALGNEVTELERISIGALSLPETLLPGQFRNLTNEEMSAILHPQKEH